MRKPRSTLEGVLFHGSFTDQQMAWRLMFSELFRKEFIPLTYWISRNNKALPGNPICGRAQPEHFFWSGILELCNIQVPYSCSYRRLQSHDGQISLKALYSTALSKPLMQSAIKHLQATTAHLATQRYRRCNPTTLTISWSSHCR